MGQEPVILTAKQEIRLFRRVRLLEKAVLGGTIPFEAFMDASRQLCDRHGIILEFAEGTPKVRDLSEEYRATFRAWFVLNGFDVEPPSPGLSNREFERMRKRGFELFYHPGAYHHERIVKIVETLSKGAVTENMVETKMVSCDGYWYWLQVDTPSEIRLDDKDSVMPEEYAIAWSCLTSQQRPIDMNTYTVGANILMGTHPSGRIIAGFRHKAERLHVFREVIRL